MQFWKHLSIRELKVRDFFSVSRMLVFLLVLFLTSVSVFTGGDQRNYLVIIFLMLVPVLLWTQYPFFRLSEWPIYVLAMSLFFTVILHRGMFRATTLMYSFLFLSAFLYLIRLLQEHSFRMEQYRSVLKYLIYAYALVLVIQQVCVVLGFPVLNQIVLDPRAAFKLNSLSPEPSYSAVVIPLLMLSYIRIRELTLGRKYQLMKDAEADKYLWVAFLYPMLTMGSGTAFIALILVASYFLNLKNWRMTLMGFFSVVLVVLVLNFLQVEAYVRAVNFLNVVFTFDPFLIVITDHSASFRIVPSILYVNMFDLFSANTWFGHGIDFDVIYFPEIIPGLEDEQGTGGIFPTFVMNFGLLSGIALLLVIRKYCLRNWWSIEALFWVVLVSFWGFNNQFAWGVLFILACNTYFYKKHHRETQTA